MAEGREKEPQEAWLAYGRRSWLSPLPTGCWPPWRAGPSLPLSPHLGDLCLGCPQSLTVPTSQDLEFQRQEDRALTVNGDLDRQAAALTDGVLHDTAVQVIVFHEHAGDGEHLVVRGQEHSRVIEEGFAILQPGVAGLGAVLVRAVQGEGLAELQHSGGSH